MNVIKRHYIILTDKACKTCIAFRGYFKLQKISHYRIYGSGGMIKCVNFIIAFFSFKMLSIHSQSIQLLL